MDRWLKVLCLSRKREKQQAPNAGNTLTAAQRICLRPTKGGRCGGEGENKIKTTTERQLPLYNQSIGTGTKNCQKRAW
jgi:hypothetical protein